MFQCTAFCELNHFVLWQVFFVESICDDPEVIAENIMVIFAYL